jgi:hypothetical protein
MTDSSFHQEKAERAQPERRLGSRLIHWALGQSASVHSEEQIKFQPDDDLTATVCLGIAIAGVNTLIGIGFMIVFA